MPRPRYSITTSDVNHAAAYLKPLLQTRDFELRGDASYRAAEHQFEEAVGVREKAERAKQLNAWCEKYLFGKTWAKLKLSIRKRRERKLRIGKTKSVTISAMAFELLQKISTRDHVTYSEALEFYLGKALLGKARR